MLNRCYCLQGKGTHSSDAEIKKKKREREREKEKVLPHVEDRTLTIKPPPTANNRFTGCLALLLVYIAPT